MSNYVYNLVFSVAVFTCRPDGYETHKALDAVRAVSVWKKSFKVSRCEINSFQLIFLSLGISGTQYRRWKILIKKLGM